jgi:N-acetylglucosamine kinase-like BadF-type ATPase
MKYVLGVDQGHSQTRTVVCDLDGTMLGMGTSRGACHSVHGMDTAMTAVQQAALQAVAQASITARDIALVLCGLTGADWPDEYDLLREQVARLGFSHNVHIKNDAIVAMRGGTWADYGAVVIAGTGSNCAIRSPRGEEFIYGFYHDIELQGSIALGRRVLAAIRRAETGREPPTALRQRVLAMFGFPDVDSLVRSQFENRLSLEDTRQIAPLVFQAAYEGDLVACKIIKSFAEGLAEMVTAGLERFNMTQLELNVVLSGSVFKGPGPLVEEVMAASIHMVAPRARLVNARYEPVVGAALLGLGELGVAVDERRKHNVERSCQELGLIRIRQ